MTSDGLSPDDSASKDAADAKRRAAYLKRTYDLTPEQWEGIFQAQGRKCPICGRGEKDGVGFSTDHSHKAPKIVRGLPCRYCNHRKIGRNTIDDVPKLQAIIDYLTNPPAQAVLPPGHTVPDKKRKQPRKRPRGKNNG